MSSLCIFKCIKTSMDPNLTIFKGFHAADVLCWVRRIVIKYWHNMDVIIM